MMHRLAILFIVICIGTSIQAQEKRISKEEFRERQEAFFIKEAGLTEEEASKFFPLYYELQDRRKAINDIGWEQMRKGKNSETTEAEYAEIIEKVAKAHVDAEKLDLEYLKKFKQILSAKKIYNFQRAEMKFRHDMLKNVHRPQPQDKDKKK